MANIARPTTPTVFSFPRLKMKQCNPKQIHKKDWSLTDRQQRISWWDQRTISQSRILVVGAGGLGSNQARVLAQMGLGVIDIVEPDLVEDSNRNRQFFTARDVGKPKAHQLVDNLTPYAVEPTLLRGFYEAFEDWVTAAPPEPYNAISCGVDSFPTMVAVASFGLATSTPTVFYNVSADGEACRIFIQRTGLHEPCFACYFPKALESKVLRDQPCTPAPAIGDILQVAVGFATRAIVGEILRTPIGQYHSRDITFGGFDIKKQITKQPACPLCAR